MAGNGGQGNLDLLMNIGHDLDITPIRATEITAHLLSLSNHWSNF